MLSSPVIRPQREARRFRSKIIKELGALGIYTKGLKYRDFTDPDSRTYNHIFSLAEGTFNDVRRNEDVRELLERHNARCLMRVYPAQRRIRSSNFSPLSMWRAGVQMAALNWQTYDEGQQLNEAMFASGSRGCGYVLKPESMRPPVPVKPEAAFPGKLVFPGPVPAPVSVSGAIGGVRGGIKQLRITIDLISAQYLHRSQGNGMGNVLNPYIQVQVYVPDEQQRSSKPAATLSSNASTLTADSSSIHDMMPAPPLPLQPSSSSISSQVGSNSAGTSATTSTTANATTTAASSSASARALPKSTTAASMTKRSDMVPNNGYNPVFNNTFDFVVETAHPELVFVRWSVWNSAAADATRPEATFTAKLCVLEEGYRHLPLFNQNGDQFSFSAELLLYHDGRGG